MLWSRCRRLLLALFALTAFALPLPALAQAPPYFWLGVRDELGTAIASGVTCHVLTLNAVNTSATVYSDAAATVSKTNPITANASGLCDWYGAVGTASYDVVVYHQRGIARLETVTVNTHGVVVNRMSPWKHIRFPFSQNASETDTGLDLPEGAAVLDVLIEVTTAVGGSTISTGTLSSESGGVAAGFASAVSTAATGFIRPQGTFAGGANLDYVLSNTRGTLLSHALVGADAVATGGWYAERPWIVPSGGATSLTYTTSAHAIAGYVHVFYLEVANR